LVLVLFILLRHDILLRRSFLSLHTASGLDIRPEEWPVRYRLVNVEEEETNRLSLQKPLPVQS
jgi:hypothetical protein